MPRRLYLPFSQTLAIGAAGATAIYFAPLALAPVIAIVVGLAVLTYAAIFGEEV